VPRIAGLLGAVAVVVLALSVADADARRKPTEKERRAILRAVEQRGGCSAYPPGSCHMVVRVSTVRHGWAAADIWARPGREGTVQPDVASVRHKRGRWRVHQIGNGGGCGVPQAVRRDLRLRCL
jgi:hypothetical protein